MLELYELYTYRTSHRIPHMLQARMIDLFHSWDADASGDITLVEFNKALEAMGMQAAAYQVTELFESFDHDKSGYIDYRHTY